MDIPGVPETITREQYIGLMTAVGLDVNELRSLEFRPDGIYAEVFATNDEGKRFVDKQTDDIAVHRVFIRVKD